MRVASEASVIIFQSNRTAKGLRWPPLIEPSTIRPQVLVVFWTRNVEYTPRGTTPRNVECKDWDNLGEDRSEVLLAPHPKRDEALLMINSGRWREEGALLSCTVQGFAFDRGHI
jgi:hypothetical protein